MAFAEKFVGNYLRIRGEKRRGGVLPTHRVELPPHTRRKGFPIDGVIAPGGTTSAYAEKSLDGRCFFLGWLELPPHTRRKEGICKFRLFFLGTTSAYAEKRSLVSSISLMVRNYLRIRGEKNEQQQTPQG
ncbi:hypothetical protein CULC0102_1883 [Corynebacterium ulcerans 0102]|nr:hypothetical protein CULC0102_1883 [Corynebacterium ulcerans 0102]